MSPDFLQSLNLYAYVGNNPIDRVDLDGHQCTVEGASTACNVINADAIDHKSGKGQMTGKGKQTYGRQTNGSYKADPKEVQAAIKAGKPIHEAGNPDQTSECVFACKQLAHMGNIGTPQWTKGDPALGLNDTSDIGLAIATLGSGRYPSEHGNSGIYMGHDSDGGLKIVDQWPGNGPRYDHPNEHTLHTDSPNLAMNAAAYYVIIVPKP